MRIIKKILWTRHKTSAQNKKYKLSCYELDSGDKIESLQDFTIGEEVTTWFDEQWNKGKLKKKRSK